MTKKRANPWSTAALSYAIPRLAGEWIALDSKSLIKRPVGLVAQGVAAQTNNVQTVLHPLYMPLDYVDTGWMLAHDHYIPGLFPLFKTVIDGEDYMERLAAVIQSDALSFFEEYGKPEGFYKWCQRANAAIADGLGDPHIRYRQAATAIILRRYEDAASSIEAVQQIAADDFMHREWLQRLSDQATALRGRLAEDPSVVRDNLLAGTTEQRRRRRLPISDD